MKRQRLLTTEDKTQIMEQIPLDTRMKFIYSGLFLADTSEMYLLDTRGKTISSGLYKQEFKFSLNRMNHAILLYKNRMYSNFSYKIREDIADKLDILHDRLDNDINILFHSINRFILKFIPNTDHATCITKVSIIEILTQFLLLRDETFNTEIGFCIIQKDPDISTINNFSRRYINAFAKMYGEVDINLNNSDEVALAFEIFSNKLNSIDVEFIKKTA